MLNFQILNSNKINKSKRYRSMKNIECGTHAGADPAIEAKKGGHPLIATS
jgi:hypothetical protein